MSGFIDDISNFSDITNHDPAKSVVVEFYSDKCRHCNDFEPVYEDVAKDHENVEFYRINVLNTNKQAHDRAIDQALACGVRGFPTIFGFKDGIDCALEHSTMYGKHNRSEFEDWVREVEINTTKSCKEDNQDIQKQRFKRRYQR